MSVFRPRIAIVGGGPGGLALGKLLQQRGICPTIYELRSKPTPEKLAKPSGMLDLHKESGLKAIDECGLSESFDVATGDCSEAMRVMNQHAEMLHTDEGQLEPRPEISRHALTNLLLQSLPSDIIKWDHKISAVQRNHNPATGMMEITLDLGANGSATYDFVVGADGAWSKVRKLLTDVMPFYSGAQALTATVRHVSTNYPHLLEVSGTGTLVALGGCNGIMCQRGPQDSIRLYAAMSTPHEDWPAVAGIQGKTAAEVQTIILADDKLYRKWAPALQDLLAIACNEESKDNPGAEADIKPYNMLPVGHRWEHQSGATLIGDAAHLMTPWAGEGVNLALWDAVDLADALAGVPEAKDAAAWQAAIEPRMHAFEETMLARAHEKAEETDQNRRTFLSENGGQAMADFFKVFDDMGAADSSTNGQQNEKEAFTVAE